MNKLQTLKALLRKIFKLKRCDICGSIELDPYTYAKLHMSRCCEGTYKLRK